LAEEAEWAEGMGMLPVYLLIIGLAMLLLVVAMYRGGGTVAVKSQLGPLVTIAGALMAFAIAIVLNRESDAIIVVGTVVAGLASVTAALLARAARTPGSSMAAWSTPLWILAGVFALLVILGVASFAT
jgi:hypothetical protein